MKKPHLLFVFALALAPLIPGTSQPTPIIPILDARSGYLLGGSQNGRWLSAKTAASGLKNGATYRVYSQRRVLGTGRATAPKSEGAPCEQTLFSKISPDFSRRAAQIALGGAHKPLTRAFRSENVNQVSYRNLVAGILRKNGIAKPKVQITQIWRVDLEGDGAQEVLLSASRKEDYGDPNRIASASRAGDYSLLLMRKINKGRAETQIIDSSFYPRAKTFNAPNFMTLAGVFDLNGDGKMEILARGFYYEGIWTTIYSVASGKAREVLSEGCGA